MLFVSSRWMVRLYCSEYWLRILGCSSPNKRIGRNTDQSSGLPRAGLRTPLKGFGAEPFDVEHGADVGSQLCKTNGVLNSPSVSSELPPNGGSPWNCSSTSCSMGL